MTILELATTVRASQDADPTAIPDVLRRAASQIGATDVVVYLVDFGQSVLQPLPDRASHASVAEPEDVATTMAGRAFLRRRPVLAERGAGTRIWSPIIEGSDVTGVLAVTAPDSTAETVAACESLALLAGYLIATHTRATDVYNLHRRRRSMSLAASMQWDLLPPLVVRTPRVIVAGRLEPAYDVGGDCFDYAVNGSELELAIFDTVGHGLLSAMLAGLTIGSYRHGRREARSLPEIHENLDAALASQAQDDGFSPFCTGLLARLELELGELTWTNAGHPYPLLIRGSRVVRELESAPRMPWGLGSLYAGGSSPVASERLEPGDSVLFYTDGAVDVHRPGGELYGVERLWEAVERAAAEGLEPEEITRKLSALIVDYHAELTDDVTFVVLRWNGPGS